MANIKNAYGTDGVAITCTLASLASAAARESTVVDNSTDLFVDALVYVAARLAAGSPTGQKALNVYVYATVDAASPKYPDVVTGADAAITLTSPTNLKLLGSIQAPASGGLTYKGSPWSVAQAFGGVLPKKWGIVIENQTGLALTGTEGDHTKTYQGVYLTST